MAQPLETTAKEQVRTLVLPTLTVSALVVVLTVCLDDVSVHATKSQAHNYGGRVPVDTTPGPAPVCRALKTHPISSSTR